MKFFKYWTLLISVFSLQDCSRKAVAIFQKFSNNSWVHWKTVRNPPTHKKCSSALSAPALSAPALSAPALPAPALSAPALSAPALSAPATSWRVLCFNTYSTYIAPQTFGTSIALRHPTSAHRHYVNIGTHIGVSTQVPRKFYASSMLPINYPHTYHSSKVPLLQNYTQVPLLQRSVHTNVISSCTQVALLQSSQPVVCIPASQGITIIISHHTDPHCTTFSDITYFAPTFLCMSLCHYVTHSMHHLRPRLGSPYSTAPRK